MGRETRNFRQTKRAGAGDRGNRNYSKINRSGSFRNILNIFRKGGKIG